MASFLLQTWHLSTRPVQLDLAPQASLKWLGLKIIHCTAGTSHDDIGMVEFIARCKQHGKAVRLHESSQFIKENGRWFYLRAN
jgi:SEC-C motif-containing protein